MIRRLFFMWGFDFLLRVAVLAEEVDLYGSEVRARTGRSLRDHESDEVAALSSTIEMARATATGSRAITRSKSEPVIDLSEFRAR